jgi:hypothetical protein
VNVALAPASRSETSADDRALAAVRRADWRFLLPDPELGRVAYLAPHEPELVEALTLAGASVDLLAAPAPTADHDVIVISDGPPATVRGARGPLRPGGWLYAEVPGRSAGAWTRALAAGGFEDVAAHWLWPDASACREIVPLERAALHLALRRRDPGARVRVRARAAGLLAGNRMFALAVRRAAVIGRRP